MKEIMQLFLTALGVLMVLSVIIVLITYVFVIIRDAKFHKRIKVGTAVKLDEELNDIAGWYVVKKRIGDKVELVRLAPDNAGKNITELDTEITVDIMLCKPL